jgi:hypothetical protein
MLIPRRVGTRAEATNWGGSFDELRLNRALTTLARTRRYLTTMYFSTNVPSTSKPPVATVAGFVYAVALGVPK